MKLSEHINTDGNNRGAAPSPQFKLAALSDLLSEIAGGLIGGQRPY